PFADPFFAAPTVDKFPTFVPGIDLANLVFDRDLRTPYFHQYDMGMQYVVSKDLLLEVTYVGTRGLDLFRDVGINQARLASPQTPIVNDVTRAVITTNTPANAQLRASFQGTSINVFGQKQTTAQSTYNSLQVSLMKRLSRDCKCSALTPTPSQLTTPQVAWGVEEEEPIRAPSLAINSITAPIAPYPTLTVRIVLL